MRGALWGRVVFFLLPYLLLQNLFLGGCTTSIGKLDTAEKELSYGKNIDEDIKDSPPFILPVAIARHKLILIMDSLIAGKFSYKDVKADLASIRSDILVPRYLRVEAGYMLTLVEKMEGLQTGSDSIIQKNKEYKQDNDGLKKEREDLKKEKEDLKKESEELKKQIELLNYKLKKLEEIYIKTEKRRGMQ